MKAFRMIHIPLSRQSGSSRPAQPDIPSICEGGERRLVPAGRSPTLPAAYLAPVPPSLSQSNFHLLIRPMFLAAPPEKQRKGQTPTWVFPFRKIRPVGLAANPVNLLILNLERGIPACQRNGDTRQETSPVTSATRNLINRRTPFPMP